MTAQLEEQTTETVRPRRPGGRVLALAAAVLVAVAAVVLFLVTRDGDDPGGTQDGAAATADPTLPAAPSSAPPATPTPEEPLEGSAAPPPTQAPVALDQTAAVGDGMTVDVVGIEEVEGTASGPGNIAGPALRVTVRLTNGTSGPVSLDGTAVELRYGFDQAPASPLEDPSQVRFAGGLEPGASVEGVYVFTVPTEARYAVTVLVEYAPGTPFVVFTGSVD